MVHSRPWWDDAVVYQIYPRSFADADGNGIGDLAGITSRVDYIATLGVDAVWLSPFYPSALYDGGYDVDDYRDVAPEIGTLADFDQMLAAFHERGIRVLVDVVPNHSSSRHPWFQQALAGGPGCAARQRYHVLPGKGEDGTEPPNDWRSLFGGPIWERIEDLDEDGQPLTGPGTGRPYEWYMHIFAPEQPDLNWDNPEVVADFEKTLRFWLDRGVDGFRVDAALGLMKDMSEPYPAAETIPPWPLPADGSHPYFDRDDVHAVYRSWRALLDEYAPPRAAIAEAGVHPERRLEYARSLGQVFNFQLQDADFTPESYRWALEAGLAEARSFGATTWTLGCHDTPRVASRYGFDQRIELEERPGDGTVPAFVSQQVARRWLQSDGAAPDNNAALGRRRARAGYLTALFLPGAMYIYQGDELGLPEVPDIPEERLQDPIAKRNRLAEKGRDGCRVPLPWTTGGATYGFADDATGLASEPHLPQPDGWGELSVQAQESGADAGLDLFRRALRLRHELWGEPGAVMSRADAVQWLEAPAGALALRRASAAPAEAQSGESETGVVKSGSGAVECWMAFDEPVTLPAGEVLISSAPIEAADSGATGAGAASPNSTAPSAGLLPANTTAWLRVS